MQRNKMWKKSLSKAGCLVWLLGTFFCLNASAQEHPKPLLIDSFTYFNSEGGSMIIDNFRIVLENSPENAGLVIVYGGKVGKKGEIEAHIRGIKQAFAMKRIDFNRSPIINGGYREKQTIEFWVIPPGADTPKPKTTVDAKKVRFKGVSKKTIPYECCF